jgi:hypothetical protein
MFASPFLNSTPAKKWSSIFHDWMFKLGYLVNLRRKDGVWRL